MNWSTLNVFVMGCKDVGALADLADKEFAGRKRKKFLMRLQSRITRLNAQEAAKKYSSIKPTKPGRRKGKKNAAHSNSVRGRS